MRGRLAGRRRAVRIAPPGRHYLTRLGSVLRNEQLVLLVLAVVVGAVSAYGAIAFRYLYLFFHGIALGSLNEATLAEHAATLPWWQVIGVPTAGGLLIGLFIHHFLPGGRPHAVADAIEAVALRSGRIGIRAGLGAALASAASIGCGASVGREGPVVHLGAALSSRIAKRLGLGRSLTINLVGCGVASAIAASFNAPIAGIFFALEVVIGHYALTAFAPIVLASVTGTIVSRAHFGNFPAFIIPGHQIVSALEFPAFALLGIVCAVAAIIFMRSVGLVQSLAERVPAPVWLRPAVAGALVGLIALAFPQVLGVGYGTTDAALKGQLALWLLLALLAAKTAATAISLGLGFAGGVFSPSLFLGAMVGGAYGHIASAAFPALSSGPTAYTLVGMGAVAGAVLGAPISTILMIFELTSDYSITVAVMVAVVIASLITHQAYGPSFFHWQLARRGLSLRGGRETALLAETGIGDVMRTDYTAVAPSMPVAALRERLQTAPHGLLFVVEGDGTLFGTITLSDLSEAAFDTALDSLVNAVDVARTRPLVLTPDADLESALKAMEQAHEEHVAVVSDTDAMKMIGVVHELDVILAYNRALMRARAEERGAL